jgi:DNA-binding winged helix-turn-helix (wHTH) protein
VYEFGQFALDLRTFELRREGARVHIERLSHDFLAYLIRHRDRVIPTHELLAELWPDTVVTRGVLARTAHRTREAIGDDAARPVWIATLRGRGYRFVGAVSERRSSSVASSPTVSRGDASRAFAQLSRDRYLRALELLDAGALAPLRRELLIGLSQALQAMGEEESAERALRQASRLSPVRSWRRRDTAAS